MNDFALQRALAAAPADIVVRRLVKSHRASTGDVLAIDGLDLSVRAGEFLCLLGPSGCGKSSLLDILAGFEPATSGDVRIGGVPVSGPTAGQGVVFQDTAALFPWLSIRDNVAFGLKNTDLAAGDIRAKVEATLRLVGLEQFGDKWPHQLSGGMRQLASIARVLVIDSRVLLMDEPFAALDALTRQQMQHKLLGIWQRTGITILLITHSVDEALYLGDRVLVLSRRPARVALEIPVPLSHPRSTTSPDFNALKSQALAQLGF